MPFESLKISAGRICDGLARIGYTPQSAICDIIDNAVTAEAKNIYVAITRDNPELSDNARGNVREYLIIDDGKGMDEDGIKEALALGASEMQYGANTLSKFGLGLKSAAFSQGEVLEVLSSVGGGTPFVKYRVSLPEIRQRDEYGTEKVDVSEEDARIIAKYLPEGHGTVIRLGEIRKANHPRIKETLEELKERVGIIYYYFMLDGSLIIHLEDSACVPFDPLFSEEANAHKNADGTLNGLNEFDWDGKDTRWIQAPITVTLDDGDGEPGRIVRATLEVTQLPHPPAFKFDSEDGWENARKKYRMEAGNYGFYVYRNKRLLGWVERFNGIVPMHGDFYGFRGRVFLDSDADDVINLDVKKSRVMLSEQAHKTLDDLAANFRRKSRKAWKHAAEEVERRGQADTQTTVNRIANQVEPVEDLPGVADSAGGIAEDKRREHALIEEQQQRFAQDAVALQTPIDELITGEDAKPSDRVFRVNHVEDNFLFEPYYDAVKTTCVRINRVHRFSQVIYQGNSQNGDLHIIFDLMLLKLAEAESFVQRKLHTLDQRVVEKVLKLYRRQASESLAELCREAEEELPHDRTDRG